MPEGNERGDEAALQSESVSFRIGSLLFAPISCPILSVVATVGEEEACEEEFTVADVVGEIRKAQFQLTSYHIFTSQFSICFFSFAVFGM